MHNTKGLAKHIHQNKHKDERGRVRVPEHWVFTSFTIAANVSQVIGSIMPVALFLRLAKMLLPLTTNERCSTLQFKSNMAGLLGSFGTQRV